MNANILILTTFVVILCRIRYALKKVHSIENDMDIRILKLLEIPQTDDDDDMKTISDDLSGSTLTELPLKEQYDYASDDSDDDLLILDD